jgi:hypothetical protein
VKILKSTFLASLLLCIGSINADDTIPLTFKDGDVISSNIINSIFSRINQVQKGFSSTSELNGTWSCTVYDTNSFGADMCTNDGSLVKSKTGLLDFNSNNLTWSWSGAGSLNDCGSGGSNTGTFDVKSGVLLTSIGVYDVRRISVDSFLWFVTNSMPPSGFNACTKISKPPTPPNNLTALLNGSDVTLTWTDQSADETGFKIQRKSPPSTTWSDIFTTPANTVMYVARADTTGTHIFRVLSTNPYGDSISSSEVLVNKP